jgi:hypothetical protein
MKTSIDVKPQNSDIYVNSVVHQFTSERGIYTEAATRIAEDRLRLQREFSLVSKTECLFQLNSFGYNSQFSLRLKSSIFWDVTPCSSLKVNGSRAGFRLGLLFKPEDVGAMFLRKVG